MTEYRLIIPGRPVPAQRMTQRTKWTARSRRSLDYQGLVARAALAARLPRPLPWEYIRLEAAVYLRPTRGGRLPGNRGDADNYLKAVADGLQYAGVLGNDRSVIDESIRIRPTLDGQERVEVILREVML
ncbi:RusA family crossover junction endodeoxyribonuclease [Symbiobacterium terraclitae]|uniref:RusA family crossover junction endodeoxyribonuclease n=1 Tax=Symbiobacterium terraclitae TaxID=557451 RepID=UPI0035B51777